MSNFSNDPAHWIRVWGILQIILVWTGLFEKGYPPFDHYYTNQADIMQKRKSSNQLTVALSSNVRYTW